MVPEVKHFYPQIQSSPLKQHKKVPQNEKYSNNGQLLYLNNILGQ